MGWKKKWLSGIAVAAFLFVGYMVGSWYFKRSFNYAWSYKSQVEGTVCDMVKPEYLKPGAC